MISLTDYVTWNSSTIVYSYLQKLSSKIKRTFENGARNCGEKGTQWAAAVHGTPG